MTTRTDRINSVLRLRPTWTREEAEKALDKLAKDAAAQWEEQNGPDKLTEMEHDESTCGCATCRVNR